MKRKLLVILLTAAMAASSAVPASAVEFSSGLEETGGSALEDNADVVDAGSDSEADVNLETDDPSVDNAADTEGSFFSDSSADAVEDPEGTSLEDTVESAFSSDEAPDISDGSEDSVRVPAARDSLDENILYSDKEKEEIKRAADEIIKEAGVTGNNTDLEKICMLISWFRKHTSYYDGGGLGRINDIYGSLVLRKSMCDGFNEGFVYLLEKCGIEAREATGGRVGSDGHAWSEVKYNGSWYIIDATATCYQAASFLEDYEHFWYHPDLINYGYIDGQTYADCKSNYSTKTIDSNGPVNYLGASGNTLYARVNDNYYKNNGVGWEIIYSADLPSQLYGQGVTDYSTEIEKIVAEKMEDCSDAIYAGQAFNLRFSLPNPGMLNNVSAVNSLTCSSSDNSIATAEIVERNAKYAQVTVRVNAVNSGSCKITVSAPNGVSCSVNVKVNGRKCPDIKLVEVDSLGWAYLKFDPKTIKEYITGGKEGYQVFIADSGSDNFKELYTGECIETDNIQVIIGNKKTVRIKCRLYTVNKDTNEKHYGDFSNILTATTPPSWSKIKSVSVKGTKAYLKWTKSKGADGYVIYRKTGKSGKYKKIKTITSGKRVKYTNTRLKKKQKYYYKIKAFYLDQNGKRVYTAWSNVKGVTCK